MQQNRVLSEDAALRVGGLRQELGEAFRVENELFRIGGTPVTIASLISFFVFLALAFLASKLLQRALGRVYRRRKIDEGVQYALNRLLHYAVIALGGFRTEPIVASDLRFAIDRAFREAGIEIPFPQRDLHLRGGWGDLKS
jgi:small-conductance mechanosensitive channel